MINPFYAQHGEGDQPQAGGGASTLGLARRLRREMSLPERLLWQRLRGRASPIKVRRQHPIGPYVADFYVASARLVVEVDGETHASRVERDIERDAYLRRLDFRIMRITARKVLADVDAAADSIVRAAMPLHPAAARRGPPPHAAHGEEFAVGAR